MYNFPSRARVLETARALGAGRFAAGSQMYRMYFFACQQFLVVLEAYVLLYICLRLTYRQGIFRRMVPDPYIFGKLSARRFDCCIVRLQQSSFRLFIARSIISTLTVSSYGGLE